MIPETSTDVVFLVTELFGRTTKELKLVEEIEVDLVDNIVIVYKLKCPPTALDTLVSARLTAGVEFKDWVATICVAAVYITYFWDEEFRDCIVDDTFPLTLETGIICNVDLESTIREVLHLTPCKLTTDWAKISELPFSMTCVGLIEVATLDTKSVKVECWFDTWDVLDFTLIWRWLTLEGWELMKRVDWYTGDGCSMFTVELFILVLEKSVPVLMEGNTTSAEEIVLITAVDNLLLAATGVGANKAVLTTCVDEYLLVEYGPSWGNGSVGSSGSDGSVHKMPEQKKI